MSTVRLVIVQGPNQMLYSLSVLRYLEATGEYKDCEDILILGGYRADPKLTEVCLQISKIWNFKSKIILHGFDYLCQDNFLDFVSASELLKRVINLQSVDVIFVLRNWQFINEVFLYAYPSARKICYGELGWLDFSSTLWSNFYGSPPINPSGKFIQIDEAYPVLVPVDADHAFEQCPIKVVGGDFFKSVIYDSAKQIQGLSNYCALIVEQLGSSITFVLTSYDTEAGFIKSYQDEIECYLSCVLPYTQEDEAIVVKGHPRQIYNQSELLTNKLCELERRAFVVSEFTQVPIELFIPFLPIKKVIAPMSSASITLGYLGASELVIGFGENLISKYIFPKCQETILIGQYQRALEAKYSCKQNCEPIKYLELKDNLKQYYQQQIYINLSDDNSTQRYVEELTEKNDFIDRVLSFEKSKIQHPDISVLQELLDFRNHLSEFLLTIEVNLLERLYSNKLGKAYQALLNSGIKNEPFTITEQNFVVEILDHLAKGFDQPKAIQYLLAVMLYCRPYQLPLTYNLTLIPNWLLNDYFQFLLQPPLYFQDIGEANIYYEYLSIIVDYIHNNTLNNPDSKFWQSVGHKFTIEANFIPLYFNKFNLKDIYEKRANIIEFYLKKSDFQIDYNFPERSPERQKIRLGILASHFSPQTETFASLSLYKNLNRDSFEIIIFTLQTSNHRLERYCAGHADTFVRLPNDLPNQVQSIRDAELDILFISTNVTAVTHAITLIALHRLARIQIVDANSPVTTGMRHTDYYLSSKLSEIEDNPQQHYTEKLITLDSPPQCFDFATEEKILATTSISRNSLGIATTAVVYVSGANYYKIIPEQEETWTKIIANVTNSVLLLYPFNPNWSSSYPSIAFRKRIVTTFAKYGLSEDRLIILEAAPNRADVKERLKIADIYLDSYPYSGMTSLIDPLEVGLPTVVMEAEPSRSRKGASLLRELEIFDLITNNEEAYIEVAVALGNSRELCKQKSATIKEKMLGNPRFLDSRSFSAKIGNLFQKLFIDYLADSLNETFSLRDINLIIFPDWHQSEDLIGFDLERVIKALTSYPASQNTTLLIAITNISLEDAEIFLSSVLISILINDDIDVPDKLEISLVENWNDIQCQALLPRLKARIVLEHENQQALTQIKVENLLSYDLDSFITSNCEITSI
ncbi:MAG: hypothetical protein RMY64_08245 [Nostoc sp. DedQUE08]|uniref:O-linked N-acetylglucosamine transferase, SPINDLY family protein n=1 Tax=unclassified Nostoc TaxID=2593658 RepID=UPI002AD2EE80|nr:MULTISPECIES: hypothetical protein [unclassified Nostoc]MDZ8065617.1 hypothetical protein [Nostoc sp. DedQUE08]MDZ8091365.1 hypothetical protein [Nostoc sp. DedQUE05]